MGVAVQLTKSEQVLEFELDLGEVPRPIIFSKAEPPFRAEARLTREFWMQLGMPETITVTFEPGDRLNT